MQIVGCSGQHHFPLQRRRSKALNRPAGLGSVRQLEGIPAPPAPARRAKASRAAASRAGGLTRGTATCFRTKSRKDCLA